MNFLGREKLFILNNFLQTSYSTLIDDNIKRWSFFSDKFFFYCFWYKEFFVKNSLSEIRCYSKNTICWIQRLSDATDRLPLNALIMNRWSHAHLPLNRLVYYNWFFWIVLFKYKCSIKKGAYHLRELYSFFFIDFHFQFSNGN